MQYHYNLKTMENLEKKYFEALKELHHVLTYTDKVSMVKFKDKNNLAAVFTSVLVKGGIIKSQGKGLGVTYKWNTIPPNIHMAKEVVKKLRENQEKYYGKPRAKKEIPKSENKTVDYYIVSMGFIKFKIKPVYK